MEGSLLGAKAPDADPPAPARTVELPRRDERAEPAPGAQRCACGGGCPRCRVPSVPGLDPATVGSAPPSLRKVLETPGRPLDVRVQSRMENLFAAWPGPAEAQTTASSAERIRLGAPDNAEEREAEAIARALDSPAPAARDPGAGASVDFSGIRVHDDAAADAVASRLGARAFTVGPRIIFADGEFAPGTQHGDGLLVHELAHSLQQRSGPPRIARSVTDWLTGSVNVEGMTYTQVLGEIDELTQWLARQIESSADTVRIEEALNLLRQQAARLEAAARGPTRRERRRRRGARAEAPLPARYPRILLEMTSVAYTDPAEMREEYDLIMQWLAREEISADQRRILAAERDNLAPQLRADRERVVRERHASRLQAALTPAAEDDARALESLSRTIVGISGEPANPEIFYLYHAGERVAISREQAEQLRADLRRELERAARQVDSRADYYWGRYNSQLAINRDSPIISAISGWLADVEDPGDELRFRYFWIRGRVRMMQAQLAAGRMVEAAAMMPELDRVGHEIRSLARAFYEGYIEGAEIAVNRLEFTRDAAFAVAGSIAAVVAAPVVAGYAAGAGFTGATATALTITGTGVTVGTGMGVVRGTSAAGGELLAGGSLSQAAASFRSEFGRGFREGFVAGAAGGAGRLLGLAARSASVGQQILIRVGGDFVVNATSTMLDVLWQTCSAGHCDIDRAVRLGITNGLASIPGSIVGLSDSSLARYFLAPLTAGATSYVSAIHAGASPEEAMRSAGVAVASNLAMSSAQHGAEADQALEARGRAAGERTRQTAAYATRRVATVGAAVMIGTAEAVPPLRSGYGGPSVVMEGGVARPAVAEAPTPLTPTVTEATATSSVETAPPTPHAGEVPSVPAPAHAEATAPSPAQTEAASTASTIMATPLDPETAWTQLQQELGNQPSQPVTGTTAQRIERSARLAEAAGYVDPQGNPIGPIEAVVGEHGHAPQRRAAHGQTGATRQSAHIGATSLLRTLLGYSRRAALTVLLPPAQHSAFDQQWMRWIANRRNAIRATGSSNFTAPLSEVLDAQRQAVRQIPGLSTRQRNTFEMLLEREFGQLAAGQPLGMATPVPLPPVLGS